MTMAVRIINDDKARTAKVEVQDFDLKRRTIACVDEFRIAPGEARTVWMHAARQFVVSEDPLPGEGAPASAVPHPDYNEERTG